jgi:hypothetical protein
LKKILTWTGASVDPLDLHPDDIDIDDIAHALSMLCRFNGHCAKFYSVAEHSVLVSQLCPPEYAMAGLLHDATEAYIADVPRPLKAQLPDYVIAENRASLAIASRFGLSEIFPEAIRQADDAALEIEMSAILVSRATASINSDIRCLLPDEAKALFMERFNELQRQPQILLANFVQP